MGSRKRGQQPCEWFERVGYVADIAELGPVTRLGDWAAKTLSA